MDSSQCLCCLYVCTNIYPNVEEKDEHSVGNHGHVECHVVLEPTADGCRRE